ncbi:MAG: hypothetical protein IH881_00975 [Myxococcales bacterium]|nr:hypothetical protein [Myxococcales bacterium]
MSFDIGNDFGLQAATDAAAARKKANDELGRTEFLTMLVAQLEHQDPLNPQDASEFSAQLAQFSSLEQLISIKASIDKLVEFQIAGGDQRDTLGEDLIAANLLGKEVSVFDDRLDVPAPGETQSISFYLDGPASKVEIRVLDDQGNALYTIPAVNPSTEGNDSNTVWQRGLNTFEWTRPTGAEDYVRGPDEVVFEISANLGGNTVRGNGVSIGTVVASSMGFDTTVLRLADGRRVDLVNVFEVRSNSEEI